MGSQNVMKFLAYSKATQKVYSVNYFCVQFTIDK